MYIATHFVNNTRLLKGHRKANTSTLFTFDVSFEKFTSFIEFLLRRPCAEYFPLSFSIFKTFFNLRIICALDEGTET